MCYIYIVKLHKIYTCFTFLWYTYIPFCGIYHKKVKITSGVYHIYICIYTYISACLGFVLGYSYWKQFDPFRYCFSLCRQGQVRYGISIIINYIKAHIIDTRNG